MLGFIGIVAFIAALLGSVMLHEYGHMSTARRYGCKVNEFFVGFGATLWSTRKGETEYGVKAVPAGGFVKIVGMTDFEEIPDEDQPRAFWRLPARKRVVVLSAGSFMHFMIFLALIPIAVVILGSAGFPDKATVEGVSACVDANSDGACAKSEPPAPGKAAGLLPGDTIVAVGGKDVTDFPSVSKAVRDRGPGPVEVVVERDGEIVTLDVDLATKPETGPGTDVPAQGFLGASPVVERTWLGPGETLSQARSLSWFVVTASAKAFVSIPAKIPPLIQQTFGGQERDPNGLVGVVGSARISGEIIDQSSADWNVRIFNFLLLIASLNFFIGVFNLLPFLPLDGGHIAIIGYEKVRGWFARIRGKADPGRVDLRKVMPAAYLFLAVLVGLTLLLVAADIINPVRLPT